MVGVNMTTLINSWRRTLRIVLADFSLLISFYIAKLMVRRALKAERKTAQRNFRELKRLREIEIQ
jgi:hypothetical protein